MEGDSPGPERLASQLAALGVERGGILVVHASFRSVGPVDGGPGALIEALSEALGPEGTLVMPSFTDWDDDRPFDPLRTPCRDLGIVADIFWRMPGVLRSDSPHAFAARGPYAAEICRPHPPDLPHGPDSPIGRVHDLDGQVLLLGAARPGRKGRSQAGTLARRGLDGCRGAEVRSIALPLPEGNRL